VAAHHHTQARARDGVSDWRTALELYESVIVRFPKDPETGRYHLHAGEASARLERYPLALGHYEKASRSGDDSIRAVGDWQQVAVTDDWYGRRRNGRRDTFEPGVDSLARQVLAAADRYVDGHPEDPRGADLIWRQGQIALAHAWHERSAADFGRMVERYPADRRTPQAAALRADAFFHLDRFADAGAAYEAAYTVASKAGVDSLARRTGEAIPICYYRDAEAAVAADSTDHRRHAALFEKVAAGWPSYKYADVAQYRAGRAYLKAGAYDEAVRALQALARNFPNSEFARDAHLEMARALEQQGRKENAAAALAEFATRFEKDSSAAEAMLKAADLYESAGRQPDSDQLRLAYVRRYPADHETAMEVYEALARRDLKSVGPDRSLASLLPAPVVRKAPVVKTAKGGKGASVASKAATAAAATAAAAAAATMAPASYLAEYMRRAEAHPELASKSLLAEVRFRQGEEARAAGAAVAIRLPLNESIQRRQKHLDDALTHYKASAAHGVSEWAHASACRIGQTLVGFGEALERSERPADLEGDNLAAYEDVLLDRAQVFFDRGEEVWVDLLRQKGAEAPEDTWIAEARSALWGRLGLRFAYRPEAEYPLIEADAPARPRPAKVSKSKKREGRAVAASRSQASAEGGK
jgi:tetratricopeptide (TPR) repeat protein